MDKFEKIGPDAKALVLEVDGCYGWADLDDFRFPLQRIADTWYIIHVDAPVDVDNVLVDVHVDFVLVDYNPDGYDSWVDA